MNIEYIARITCSCGTTIEVEAFAAYETFGYDGVKVYLDHEYLPDGWIGGYDEKHDHKCPNCVEVWKASSSMDIEDIYK